MTKVMNVAMIGGGFMGKAHAMAYASMPMFFWPAPAIPHRKVVVDMTDGVRMTFADGDIVHLRASGNAPELRCYAEAASLEVARALAMGALSRVL